MKSLKSTDMLKRAVKWYFESAAMLYPYQDLIEQNRELVADED